MKTENIFFTIDTAGQFVLEAVAHGYPDWIHDEITRILNEHHLYFIGIINDPNRPKSTTAPHLFHFQAKLCYVCEKKISEPGSKVCKKDSCRRLAVLL